MRPRRATSVTTPAISPASMCACMAGPMRASRSDDMPTSSGFAGGDRTGQCGARPGCADDGGRSYEHGRELGHDRHVESPFSDRREHGSAASPAGIAAPRRLSKTRDSAASNPLCFFTATASGGPHHETLAAFRLDRRLLGRRRHSALRRRAGVRRDGLRRSREARAAGDEDHAGRARAGRRLQGAGRAAAAQSAGVVPRHGHGRARDQLRGVAARRQHLERPLPSRRRRRSRRHHQLSRDGRSRAQRLRVVVDGHGPRRDRHRVAATTANASSTTAIARFTR